MDVPTYTSEDAPVPEGTVVIDFRVEQEDAVYPMVPAGADLHDMIQRPKPGSAGAMTRAPAWAIAVKVRA